MSGLWWDVLILLGAGVLAGFTTGLLGVSGGIVTIPIFSYVLPLMGVPADEVMHVSVATSFLVIGFMAVVNFISHHKRGSVDWTFARVWAPFVFLGAVLGGFLSHYLPSEALKIIFAIVTLLVGAKMALSRNTPSTLRKMPRFIPELLGFLIGLVSSLIGLGGGVLLVATLNYLGYEFKRAVGTSAVLALMVSIPGLLSGLWNGRHVAFPDQPFMLGYVHLIAAVCLIPPALLLTPQGAKVAHLLPARVLKVVFALYMVFAAGRVLWSLFS